MAEKDKRARKGVQTIVDYQSVFMSAHGQNVLYDMMKNHNILDTTYTNDLHESLIREGERRVVLRILKLLKTNPNELLERIRTYEKQME